MRSKRKGFTVRARWVVTVIVLVVVAAPLISAQAAWTSIERVPMDGRGEPGEPPSPGMGAPPPAGAESPPSPSTPEARTMRRTTTTVAPSPREQLAPGVTILTANSPPEVVALIGSDSRRGIDDLTEFGDFEGERADVIVLALRRGEMITLLSIPRDLHVEDRCRGGAAPDRGRLDRLR